MAEGKDDHTYWKVSYFFYWLAIITLIIAIVCAIWVASKDGATLTDNEKHTGNRANWLFLASISLGVLGFLAQQYEMRHMMMKGM